MNEIRNNSQNTDETDTTSETVEAGAVVANEPTKVDSIAAVLVEKETNDPGSSQQDSIVEPTDTNREVIDTGVASIVQGIGHQLKAARIARCMSIEDVSRQLKISVQQIEAIEKEDFGKLPGRTFLRGFIRNYTNLMQLDSAPILKLLPQSSSIGATFNSQYQTQEMSFSSRKAWSGQDYRPGKGYDYKQRRRGFLLVVVLMLSLLFIGYAIYQSVNWEQLSIFNKEIKTDLPLETGAESGKGVMELELPLPPVMPLNNAQGTNHSAQPMGMTPLGSNSTSPAELPLSSVPLVNSKDSDSGVLQFKFMNESWVEVRDGADKIISEQLNASGTEQIMSGKRPLSLVVGNAADVNLTYNGRSIDLAPYTDENKGIARLTLE